MVSSLVRLSAIATLLLTGSLLLWSSSGTVAWPFYDTTFMGSHKLAKPGMNRTRTMAVNGNEIRQGIGNKRISQNLRAVPNNAFMEYPEFDILHDSVAELPENGTEDMNRRLADNVPIWKRNVIPFCSPVLGAGKQNHRIESQNVPFCCLTGINFEEILAVVKTIESVTTRVDRCGQEHTSYSDLPYSPGEVKMKCKQLKQERNINEGCALWQGRLDVCCENPTAKGCSKIEMLGLKCALKPYISTNFTFNSTETPPCHYQGQGGSRDGRSRGNTRGRGRMRR